MIERDEVVREERDRRARRAIGWGAAIVLGFMILGMMLMFVPVATGGRLPYIFSEFDWVVVAGAGAVGLVGIVVILYGLVQLARSRRDHEQPA